MEDESLSPTTNKPEKKKSKALKYIIYFVVIIVATAISLTISLWGDNWNHTISAFQNADWKWLAFVLLLVFVSYCLEALILMVFCRLYTRQYKFHQGLANSFIGAFYNDVTPASAGGQVMQAYTLKSQGIQVSNAASIMVMWFILYQSSLIIFDIFAIGFEWRTIFDPTYSGYLSSLTIPGIQINGADLSVPTWALIVIGFILNIGVIFMLYGMSFSHKLHNFILHHVIGFFGKIHLIKEPDKVRESLRVQVENFKIELRRLQANIPVTILIVFLFFLVLVVRYSIPYFVGMSLDAFDSGFLISSPSVYDFGEMMRVAFRSAFHQMVTGLVPLPGSAGVSELFFTVIFTGWFDWDKLSAVQIIWRTATFHVVLLAGGLVSSLYHSRPKENIVFANRQTFVDMQLETYDERRVSANTMFETSQLSRKELQRKMNERFAVKTGDESKKKKNSSTSKSNNKRSRKASNEEQNEWGTIEIDE